ncbi:MAG: methyltransferase domain-containing protein [Clostridia bacterium]|nr:methyltransferase domain-containing protein [Clostridia bacterium]
MLRCPVCKEPIFKQNDKIYCCSNNHSFDIAKKGYVNFLLAHKMNSKLPGDNKLMVDARSAFLGKGYYNIFRDNLKKIIDEYNPINILDAGCGEGYYTDGIYQDGRTVIGIDISKTALQKAAPKNKNITYITASLFDIPLQNESTDLLFSLFAPYAGEEFHRVLKKDGIMILGIPGENHLIELKNVIYEKPYKNQVKDYELSGFKFQKAEKIETKILLECQEDILNLFQMTPYYYRTKQEDLEKIHSLSKFDVTISFELLVYQKI